MPCTKSCSTKKAGPVIIPSWRLIRAFETMTGLKKDQIIGKNVTEVLPGIETDPADWISKYGDVALTGKEIRFEQYAEQVGKWFSVLAYQNQTNQFATVFQDITSQKMAADAIADSEARYRALFDSSPYGIMTISQNWRVMNVNQAQLDLTGFQKSDFVDKHILKIPTLVKQDLGFYKKAIMDSLSGKLRDNTDFSWKHASGEIREGQARISTLQLDGTNALQVILEDTTERKIAENKIFESEQLYRQLYQSSGTGVGYYSTDGKVITYNSIALQQMGMDLDQVVGKSVYDLFPEENAGVYQERLDLAIRNDQLNEYEDNIEMPQGTKWFLSIYSPVEKSRGENSGCPDHQPGYH